MARRVSIGLDEPLALDGRSSPKVRARRSQDITPEQIDDFFAALADTCNVVRSAKAAGFSANWAYRRRKTDASFRAGWARAIAEGYAKLELVLLERAMKGTPKLVRTARGTDRVMREYSTALAVALLKRHADLADSASAEPDEDEVQEVRERILEKLLRLKEREDSEIAAGLDCIETKAAVDRVELVQWALGRARAPHPPTASRRVPPSPAASRGEGLV